MGIALAPTKIQFHVLNNPSFQPVSTAFTDFNLVGSASSGLSVTASRDGKHVAVAHTGDEFVYVYERKPCHSSCATCSGPSANQCTACVNGVKSPPTAGTSGTCTYTSNTNCLDMELGSSIRCATCKQTSSLKYLKRSTATCVEACNTSGGEYLDFPFCEACHPSCQTCENSHSCLSCPDNHILDAGSKLCVACASNQFVSGNVCTDCPASCATCSSSSGCQTCLPTLFWKDEIESLCFPCAGAGQFVDSDKVCRDCSDDCLTCSGSATNCLTCGQTGQTSLWLLDSKCVACNEPGYF